MFFKGVVEDNLDPLKLGRVKVRVIGKHTDNKVDSSNVREYLPTVDLPYATPIFGVGDSSVSGVCDFSCPVINSIVVCGYFDLDEQELFYIGTVALLGTEKIVGYGVSSNENPKKEYPLSDSVSSPSDVFPSSITTNTLFTEPVAQHQNVYPNNRVIETKSGHLIELDDNEGSERIRIRHRSGSFNETHVNGDNVDKSVKDKYIIADGELDIHSNNNTNLNVGSVLNIEVASDTNLVVGGNTNITVQGDTNLIVQGSTTMDTKISTTIKSPIINLLGNISATNMVGATATETKTTDTVQTGTFVLNGGLTINGDIGVTGNIGATGNILAAGASDNHHSH